MADRVPAEAVERMTAAMIRELERWGYERFDGDRRMERTMMPGDNVLELCAERALEASGARFPAPGKVLVEELADAAKDVVEAEDWRSGQQWDESLARLHEAHAAFRAALEQEDTDGQ